MPTKERIFGPYAHGRAWRVVVVDGSGQRRPVPFPTRERAETFKLLYESDIDRTERNVDQAIDDYEKHLIAKGNKPTSYKETVRRLRRFFGDLDAELASLTAKTCAALYDRLVETPIARGKDADGNPKLAAMRPDSHRNYMLEARSFLRWCVGKTWIPRNPLDGLEGKGARNHGKDQLRVDEARLWRKKALRLAETEPGAIAALVALELGLRASEIVGLLVRDVDDGGRLLWVAEDKKRRKTEKARRQLEIPDDLRPLLRRLAKDRPRAELLFGQHWRDWPREWVQRICEEAGVSQVTAQGMRDTFATFGSIDALARGRSLSDVADQMGHEDFSTTERSYADPKALDKARRRRALQVLKGGRR